MNPTNPKNSMNVLCCLLFALRSTLFALRSTLFALRSSLYAHRSKLIVFCFLLLALSSLLYAFSLEARVTGECSNCHTMHNSQGGSDMQTGYASTSGAKASLLRANSCLGCHATTGSGSTGVGGAPIVYNTSQPTYGDSQPDGKRVGLAAGNFYWTTEASAGGQSRGHSLGVIPYLDDASTPSTPLTYQRGSCGTNCHGQLSNKGCKSCHLPAHHKGDSSGGWADKDNGYYRFLGPLTSASADHKWGVRGYEDPDWQKTSGSSDHNEYSGEGKAAPYFSISHFCVGCHYKVWDGKCKHFVADPSTSTKHQATLVLPDPGVVGAKYKGYVGYGEHPSGPWDYDPKLPIARTNISTGSWPYNRVNHSSTDALMCLTCHRAHASPYNKMLRWDNTVVLADQGTYYGCLGCHSPDPQTPP
ncbi:MAG: cytochrome c3 family protein [Candidatus Subteraquimicrobiales bacterium]|nr:cytochrome c3 family protein [Candidatus Subteraquimicrobiales bacterium]